MGEAALPLFPIAHTPSARQRILTTRRVFARRMGYFDGRRGRRRPLLTWRSGMADVAALVSRLPPFPG